MGKSCKHRKSWVLGSSWLWCYECGAIMLCDKVPGTSNSIAHAWTRWAKPTGSGGENPYDKVKRKDGVTNG